MILRSQLDLSWVTIQCRGSNWFILEIVSYYLCGFVLDVESPQIAVSRARAWPAKPLAVC
jgi:hypothetical protein